MKMGCSSVIVFGSLLLGFVSGFPRDMPVVRPNHYLQQGTFAKEQHILPQSFYIPHHPLVHVHPQQQRQNVESDLRRAASSHQPQQQQVVAAPANLQQNPTNSAPPTGGGSSGEAAPTAADSYLNIGGASGSIASSLTNTHEYGEIVPKAFSNLQQDSYAYYHGQNNNEN